MVFDVLQPQQKKMSKYFKKIEENMDVNFLAKLDEAREYACLDQTHSLCN